MNRSITVVLPITLLSLLALGAAYLFTPSSEAASTGGTVRALTTNARATTTPSRITRDIACVRTAVGVREAAFITAWDTFSDGINTALTARKTALDTAWNISGKTARDAAVRAAWQTWQETRQALQAQHRTSRQNAAAEFTRTVRTSCKVTLPREETQGARAAESVAI